MKRVVFFLIVFASVNLYCYSCWAQVIVTCAGTGVGAYSGDGGPATVAELRSPSGVVFDKNGNLYIADQNANCIRLVTPAGMISTIAGTGGAGALGDGGPATSAELHYPQGLTVDTSGSIYIADQFNNVIRKVNSLTGTITTFAGTIGTIGYSGDGGLATDAHLWHPADVAADQYGNVYFVDQDNSAMRKVSPVGKITTVAGTGVSGYSGDGGQATAAMLNFPQGIALDTTGNVYIADLYNSRIRRVNVTTGIITTVAGNGTGGYSGDGGPATNAALYDASAIAIDSNGNMYISDYYNSRIRKVSAATGKISTIGGNGTADYCCDCSMATSAEIYYPQGVAVGRHGDVYVADYGNSRVRKITDSFDCPSLKAGVQEISGFSLFPNPSSGQFTIQVNEQWKGIKVEIFNAIGVKVYEAELKRVQTEIDLAGLRAGIYTVFVKSAGEVIVKKLLIR